MKASVAVLLIALVIWGAISTILYASTQIDLSNLTRQYQDLENAYAQVNKLSQTSQAEVKKLVNQLQASRTQIAKLRRELDESQSRLVKYREDTVPQLNQLNNYLTNLKTMWRKVIRAYNGIQTTIMDNITKESFQRLSEEISRYDDYIEEKWIFK